MKVAKEFYAENDRFEILAAESKEQLEALERKMQTSMNRSEIIEEYTDITSLNREIVDKLIDYINVGRRDSETKQIPMAINWNF